MVNLEFIKPTCRVGLFDSTPSTGELRQTSEVVQLQAQPAIVLGVLLYHGGEIVPRQALHQEVGGNKFVEFDQGLNFCIRQIGVERQDGQNLGRPPRQGINFHGGLGDAAV